MKYVPLHIHSEYSLLDGAIRAKELCEFASKNDMPAIAITDHGTMSGVIDFYRTAKNYSGLKVIAGCEFYVIEGDITEKNPDKRPTNFHLVLLAKNKEGYQNLVKLISKASIDGYYYKPRINHEQIKQHSEGLICLSACIQGEVAHWILEERYDKAKEVAEFYKSLWGEDFYIELQDHGIDKQKRSNPKLIQLAKELGLKTVITNDSHYLQKEDSDWHDTLLCLQTNAPKNSSNRFKFDNDEFYVKTVDELRKSFDWLDEESFNEAINNTVEVAEKCHLVIEMGKYFIPKFEVPTGHTEESYLDYLATEGLKRRYKEITPEIKERYEYERSIIQNMGFSGYFLIVWDFINWSRENGIPVGPGRGSAAGSLIAYALGITNLDPMANHLLFERFLNSERVSMPDIDVDICKAKRGDVIDYVTRKYGADHVCQIITFNTLAAKASIKGVARVREIPFQESNQITSLIPFGPDMTIEKALKESIDFKKKYETDPVAKQIIDEARKMEGIKNSSGMHAAGVIISHKPLDDIIPVRLSKEGIVISQYAMNEVGKLGLLKMDFLGLETLTIIAAALKQIKERHGIDIDIDNIPLDDEKTYKLLATGDTEGVFQLESSGMKKTIKDLKPTVFEDLSVLVALYRPGPLGAGMVDEYIQRKHGKKTISYVHPDLEPILKDTYGTMVYQEQIMQIAQVLSGYTLGQADILRRAMGKKDAKEMANQKSIFLEGAKKNGVSEKIASDLFEDMQKFAEYCFNRSHSAAYGFVAYQTAYLKAHYPVEFMSAMLSSVANNQDKTQMYIAQCKDMGIEVLAPDINKSQAQFTPDGNNIRFGLASIKNVGMAIIEAIEEERKNGEFKSFYDFCLRADPKCLNKKALESLIKSGTFSEIEKSRKQLVENIEYVVSQTAKINEMRAVGQTSLFSTVENKEDIGIPAFELQGTPEEYKDFEIQMFEKELLGFYVTSHPLAALKDKMPFLTTHKTAQIQDLPDGKHVTVCGLLSLIQQKFTKKNLPFKTGVIEDLSGKIEFVAFPKICEKFTEMLRAENKVILSAKVQRNDDIVNLVVDEVKSVEDTNLVTVSIKSELPFEKMVCLKDCFVKYKGSDPLLFDIKGEKILSGNGYWVRGSQELVDAVRRNFEEVEIGVKPLMSEN